MGDVEWAPPTCVRCHDALPADAPADVRTCREYAAWVGRGVPRRRAAGSPGGGHPPARPARRPAGHPCAARHTRRPGRRGPCTRAAVINDLPPPRVLEVMRVRS